MVVGSVVAGGGMARDDGLYYKKKTNVWDKNKYRPNHRDQKCIMLKEYIFSLKDKIAKSPKNVGPSRSRN